MKSLFKTPQLNNEHPDDFDDDGADNDGYKL